MSTATIFRTTALPADHFTVNGLRFYTIRQVAQHIGVTAGTIRNRCREGSLAFIVQPGLRTAKKLIPEQELVRFLEAELR
jgi:hypothetical protein